MRKQLFPLIMSLFLCLPSLVKACDDYIILRIENVDNDDGSISSKVYAEGFKDIVGFQFSLAYDFKNYAFQSFKSELFSSLNYNENPFGVINLSYVDMTSMLGFTQDKDQPIVEFVFKKIGTENFSTKILDKNNGGLDVEFINNKNVVLCPFSNDFLQPNLGLTIKGNVLLDLDSNCIANQTNSGVSDWYINVAGPSGQYLVKVNDDGSFQILANEAGTYKLTSVPPYTYWTNCDDVQVFVFDPIKDNGTSQSCQFLAQPNGAICPVGKIEISNPVLKRCFDNVYYVTYSNVGTGPLVDGKIEVQLDERFLLQACSMPNFIITNDNRLIANVATLQPMKKNEFYFEVYVDCDKSLEGQSHCVEARILPYDNCSANYTGPKLDLKSECKDNKMKFTFTNVGQQSMVESLNYIVIEDDVMKSTEPVKLQAAESLEYSIEATSSTYRIISPQVKDYKYQSFVTKAIEACTTDPNPSLGYINNFQEADEEFYVDILCKENTGILESNQLSVLPEGYGNDKKILPNTTLDYNISFHNTGTDTAQNVVIIDTLSSALDLSTFTLKHSSHPVNISIKGSVIRFEYKDIMLLDSAKSKSESYGYLSFSIATKKDLDNVFVINKANIYFDVNGPVVTNTIRQVISTWTSVNTTNEPSDRLLVTLHPNPTAKWVYFENLSNQPINVNILDTRGNMVDHFKFSQSQFTYDAGHLKGLYFCQSTLPNGAQEVVKFIVD